MAFFVRAMEFIKEIFYALLILGCWIKLLVEYWKTVLLVVHIFVGQIISLVVMTYHVSVDFFFVKLFMNSQVNDSLLFCGIIRIKANLSKIKFIGFLSDQGI